MAIKHNELRIGNFVQDEHGIVKYVYRLWQGGAELAEDENGGEDLDYTNEEIFGVPINEEWLGRFGFKREQTKINGATRVTHSRHVIESYALYHETQTPFKDPNLHQGHTHIWMEFGEVELYLDNLKYVHQLQNFYFALTGTELAQHERNYEIQS